MDIHWPEREQADLPCPVCDAPGPHPVLLQAGAPVHTLIRCTRCTACFFRDMKRPDYANDAESELFQQMYLEQNASIAQMSGVLFRLDDPAIDSVLDVGCGFGYPTDVAAKVLGWRACGVDPSHYAELGARLLDVDLRREYLTMDSDLGEPFSLVMGSEVIEHIQDPYAFTALLRRWMKPGGYLILTTPDASMLLPSQDPATMFCMLSVGAHLILYTAQSMELMLRRAGFSHVHIECGGNTLTAYAADDPLRFHADSGSRHFAGYRAYLQHLVNTAELGSPLWNGAAGRLFTADSDKGPLDEGFALWGRIVSAWRQRFGIDHRLLPPLPELGFGQDAMALLHARAASQPFNLGGVLCSRALLESRVPGRRPESVLAFARPAYTIAVQTRRVLEEAGLIDLDLYRSAWQSRLMIVDCLAELAPELELELLAGVASPVDPQLGARIDIPRPALLARLAPPFLQAASEGRYAEAARLESVFADLGEICALRPVGLAETFQLLYQVGILRLNYRRDLPGARHAFQRLADEAAGWADAPDYAGMAQQYRALGADHVALVDRMMEPAVPPPATLAHPPAPQPRRRRKPGAQKVAG